MKQRKPEAARLEADYLQRVRDSLQHQDPSEVEEILDSLKAHIEEEVSAGPDDMVTLVDMANVLERLGPPEAFLQEDRAVSPETPVVQKTPPPAAEAGPSAEERLGFADLLDKLWLGYLVVIVGLYIPVIDFYFCSIIGGAIIAVALLRHAARGDEDVRSAGWFAMADVFLLFMVSGGSLLMLASPFFSFILLPVALAEMACGLIVLWKIMGKTASVVTKAGHQHVAGTLYSARIAYVVYSLVLLFLGFMVGGLVALLTNVKHGAELWWLGLLFLPINWIVGPLLILRPLGRARTALRS